MNYTIYEVNEYSIGISSNKNIIIILVKNNINNDKYNIRLDKLADCYANTNCENNISFGLISDIYEFIINCLDKKPFYNIKYELQKSTEQYDDEKDELSLIFSFKYENFNFEYTIHLYSE